MHPLEKRSPGAEHGGRDRRLDDAERRALRLKARDATLDHRLLEVHHRTYERLGAERRPSLLRRLISPAKA